jgi:hypothetical protein
MFLVLILGVVFLCPKMEKRHCHLRVGRSRLWHEVWYVLDRNLLNMEKGHCHQRVGRSRLWQELTKYEIWRKDIVIGELEEVGCDRNLPNMEKRHCHLRVGRSRLWQEVWFVLDWNLPNMEKRHCHLRVGRSRWWQEVWYALDRNIPNMEKGHCHLRVGRLLHISYLVSFCHSLLLPTLWWQCPFSIFSKFLSKPYHT